MSLSFHLAEMDSLQSICRLYQDVALNMRKRGLRQWEWGVYPSEEILRHDIEAGILYQMKEDGKMIGAFVLSPEQEAEYAKLSWHFGVKPATLHRLALRPDCYGLGLAQRVLVYAKGKAERLGYDSLRLDTSTENERALKLFRSAMTRSAGMVYLGNSGVAYECFESPVTDDCPMLPIRMYPAYRHGDMTPWGGDGLRRVFGKPIPDERTGEALEISAIPGLESQDEQGERLHKLIARYGRRLMGESQKFPLLLKLISAKDKLSVQVHPDDAYSLENESKLGKSEAWVILQTEEGAQILYGMQPGVTVGALKAALDAGEDIEPMMKSVPAKAGDVFYIPSGMVHAIGGGIVLYEIQQSSDVTYRLWDFQRKNDKGELRELHLRQALDVLNPRLLGEQTELPSARDGGIKRILSVPAFKLDCACCNAKLTLETYKKSFRMLTALEELILRWDGAEMKLAAGESVLLPALCPELTMLGVGRALIAATR